MNLNIMQNYKTIVFDCDGVLLDINQKKINAFKAAICEYPIDIQDKFVEYCSNSFGISRYKKFEEFFNKFSRKPFDNNEYNILLERYSKICTNEYLVCPITKGTMECLNKLKNSGFNLYISSGSDENELIETFRQRKLIKFFNQIFGSPGTKDDSLKEILKKHDRTTTLFIGDSFADMQAAKNNSIEFIYMSEYTVQSKELHDICIENSIKHIQNLSELFE